MKAYDLERAWRSFDARDIPDLRVGFAGTPEFAARALSALLDHGYRISCVLTQPDRAAGRGRKIRRSAVKQVALDHELTIQQPASLRHQPELIDQLHALQADVWVVAAYGLMIPSELLEMPRLGCVNIHASLLPKWRGAAPIQRAILAGDAITGISLMAMDEGLDTGDVLAACHVPISDDTNATMLHDQLAELGAKMIVPALRELDQGQLQAVAQDDRQATYATKLSKGEARIDWHQSAERIAAQVRAFHGWPVAHTQWYPDANQAPIALRIWSAAHDRASSSGESPGEVIGVDARGVHIACETGVLYITELQPVGKRRMSADDFARSRHLIGTRCR